MSKAASDAEAQNVPKAVTANQDHTQWKQLPMTKLTVDCQKMTKMKRSRAPP